METRGGSRGEEAVTPVLGTVLLMAVLVALSLSVYFLLQLLGDEADAPPVAFADAVDGADVLSAADGQDIVAMERRGGELLLLSDVRFTVDDVPVLVESCGGGPDADGYWTTGETICLAEPSGVDVAPGDVRVRAIQGQHLIFDQLVLVG